MNERRMYYTVLPAPVRYSKRLKASEKIFYSEIASLCNEHGFCKIENSYFAELYDVSKSTISLYISSLQKEGFIFCEIDKEIGNSRKIYICDLLGKK